MVKQYQVDVDPNRLRAYSIPLSHIRNAIKKANQETGASVIEMAEAEYMVRVSGYLQSIDDLEKVPLGVNKNGVPLLLRDVADITLGPQMRRGVAELNGEGEVVGGIVVMRFGENAQTTIDGVKDKLEKLKVGLPDGVEIIEIFASDKLQSKLLGSTDAQLRNDYKLGIMAGSSFLTKIEIPSIAYDRNIRFTSPPVQRPAQPKPARPVAASQCLSA